MAGMDNESDDASVSLLKPSLTQQHKNIQTLTIIYLCLKQHAKFHDLKKDEYERESKAKNYLASVFSDDHGLISLYGSIARDIWNCIKAQFWWIMPIQEDEIVALTLKTKGGLELLSFDDLRQKKEMTSSRYSHSRLGEIGKKEGRLQSLFTVVTLVDWTEHDGVIAPKSLSSTSGDSNSVSNDFVSYDNSDKSSEVNTNDFASSDSSVKSSKPKSNDSTSCASTSSRIHI
ncbi:hypothetical protein Tco_1419346 [Tanacetum coccineum]